MSTPNHSARKHARLSPSNAAQWAVCTASLDLIDKLRAEKRIPMVKPSSKAADEGTMAHEVCESLLLGKPNKMPSGVPADMMRHCKAYVAFVRSHPCRTGYEVEAKIPLWYDTSEPQTGSVDFLAVDPAEINITDLKYGRGVKVDAKENLQTGIYATGAIKRYLEKHPGFTITGTTPVKMHIYQPRCQKDEDEGPAATWATTWDGLQLFIASRVEHPAAIVLDEDKKHLRKYHADSKTCKWCPAKGLCKAHNKYLLTDTPIEEYVNSGKKLSDGMDMDDFELAAVYAKTDEIRAWLDGIAKLIELRQDTTNPVPGHKLVEGKGSRQWVDEAGAEQQLKRLGLTALTMALRTQPEFRSPAQVADLLDEAVSDGLLSKEWFKEFMKTHVVRIPGKPILAFANDPRPAVSARTGDAEFGTPALKMSDVF